MEPGGAISGEVTDWVDCSGMVATGRRAGAALFPYASAQGFPWFVADWGTLTVNPLASKGYALTQGMFLILLCVSLCMTRMPGTRMSRGCMGLLRRRVWSRG